MKLTAGRDMILLGKKVKAGDEIENPEKIPTLRELVKQRWILMFEDDGTPILPKSGRAHLDFANKELAEIKAAAPKSEPKPEPKPKYESAEKPKKSSKKKVAKKKVAVKKESEE